MKLFLNTLSIILLTTIVASASVTGKNGETYYYPWQGEHYQAVKVYGCIYYSKSYNLPVSSEEMTFHDVVLLYSLLAQPVYDQQAETDRRVGNVMKWGGRLVPSNARHIFFDALLYLPSLLQVKKYDDMKYLIKTTIDEYKKWDIPVSDEMIRLQKALLQNNKSDALGIIHNSDHHEVELDEELGMGSNKNVHNLPEYIPEVCKYILSKAQNNMETNVKTSSVSASIIEKSVYNSKQLIDIKKYRSKLKVGDDTHCGMVLEIKKPIIKVQTIVGEKWFKLKQLYPKGTRACRFINNEYIDN